MTSCPVYSETMVQKAGCSTNPQIDADTMPPAKAVADRLTAGHAVLNGNDSSRSGDLVAMVVQDELSKWSQACPGESKKPQECMKAFQRFLGPFMKANHGHIDNSRG